MKTTYQKKIKDDPKKKNLKKLKKFINCTNKEKKLKKHQIFKGAPEQKSNPNMMEIIVKCKAKERSIK